VCINSPLSLSLSVSLSSSGCHQECRVKLRTSSPSRVYFSLSAYAYCGRFSKQYPAKRCLEVAEVIAIHSIHRFITKKFRCYIPPTMLDKSPTLTRLKTCYSAELIIYLYLCSINLVTCCQSAL